MNTFKKTVFKINKRKKNTNFWRKKKSFSRPLVYSHTVSSDLSGFNGCGLEQNKVIIIGP